MLAIDTAIILYSICVPSIYLNIGNIKNSNETTRVPNGKNKEKAIVIDLQIPAQGNEDLALLC